MAATDVITTALERNWSMVDNAIQTLADDALTQQPNDQSNSAAWLLWHMNRVVDNMIQTRLQSQRQLWVSGGWHQKFAMSDVLPPPSGGLDTLEAVVVERPEPSQ